MAQADERQLTSMVDFILLEAREKVREIQASAHEDAIANKQSIIHQEQTRIDSEFARKQENLETQRRVAQSQKIRDRRLALLSAKEEIMGDLKTQTMDMLKDQTKQESSYKKLLTEMTAQAVVHIYGAGDKSADALQVACIAGDKSRVQSILGDASKKAKAKTGADVTLKVSDTTLPDSSLGGVLVHTADRAVVLNNTFEARLTTVFEEQMPLVRAALFS